MGTAWCRHGFFVTARLSKERMGHRSSMVCAVALWEEKGMSRW